MSYDRQDHVHIAPLQRVATSKKSMLVKPPGAPDDAAVWLPLKMIEATDLDMNGAEGHVVIPFWLAEDRGLEDRIVDPDDPNELPPNEPAQDVGESASDDDDEAPPF